MLLLAAIYNFVKLAVGLREFNRLELKDKTCFVYWLVYCKDFYYFNQAYRQDSVVIDDVDCTGLAGVLKTIC